MKWLIVTADDFGITSGINRGIIQAHCEGILTSTSLMVDRPAGDEAGRLAREYKTLCVGMHLGPDTKDPDLVPSGHEREYHRVVELVGCAPTHADWHHRLHSHPRGLVHA